MQKVKKVDRLNSFWLVVRATVLFV